MRGSLLVVAAFVCLPSLANAGPEDFLGAERCGACHQKEYEDWKSTSHARALAKLSEVQQRNAACRNCHTMVPTSNDPALGGVQCESCHGPGRTYAPEYVMRDTRLRELLGLKTVDAKTCAPCHRGETPGLRPFDYAALITKVNHGKPAPEATP